MGRNRIGRMRRRRNFRMGRNRIGRMRRRRRSDHRRRRHSDPYSGGCWHGNICSRSCVPVSACSRQSIEDKNHYHCT